MSADGSPFIYPTGKTPEQLYQTLKVLIDRLNQVKTKDSTDLTALNAAISAAQADIVNIMAIIESLESGSLSPQQAFELSLVTAVDTMLGSVSNLVLDAIKRSQDAAAATIRSLVEGQKNKGEIRVLQSVQVTDREAVATQLTTISAQILNALGLITEEITARADGDNVLAAVDQQITTALNGNIAQVQIMATSIDGIEQKFAVSLNANGDVIGLIQLDGTPAGSNFTVVADKFLVAQRDLAGGAPVPVFTIGNVGGVNKLIFRGDMHGDGSITVNKLNAASIATLYVSDPTNTFYNDFANGRQGTTDGKFLIDSKNRRILALGN